MKKTRRLAHCGHAVHLALALLAFISHRRATRGNSLCVRKCCPEYHRPTLSSRLPERDICSFPSASKSVSRLARKPSHAIHPHHPDRPPRRLAMTASETALFDRVRQSGTCPPSLLKEGGFGEGDDGFAAAVLSVLDGAASGTFPTVRCLFREIGDLPAPLSRI